MTETLTQSQEIILAACRVFNVRPEDILGPSRLREFVIARQACHYVARRHTSKSLPAIGRDIGRRDHTSVSHSISAVERRMDESEDYRKQVEMVARSVGLPSFHRHGSLTPVFRHRRVTPKGEPSAARESCT